MGKEHLSKKSKDAQNKDRSRAEDVRYYEEPRGLEIYVRCRTEEPNSPAQIPFYITVSSLRAYLRRVDK